MPGGNGCPLLNVPEGVGFPPGWTDPGVVFYETVYSLGIGALVIPCSGSAGAPEASEDGLETPASWGRIKGLYR